MFRSLVLLVIVSLTQARVQDLTRVPGASGSDVVETVVGRLKLSSVFPDDISILRRLALEESHDGTDGMTYREGYDGGIWQIDIDQFNEINKSPKARSLFGSIMSQFAIDWNTVQWSDLRKPLYSGLAAALYLTTISEEVPKIVDELSSFYGAPHQYREAVNPCKDAHANNIYYYPHPSDKNKYIQCDPFGDAFEKTCPANKIWHQIVLQCILDGLYPDGTILG